MPGSLIHQIEIEVNTGFSETQSRLELEEYFYTYHIRISNHSDRPVQLMYRRWLISDCNGESRFVEGEGVVGAQPMLEPGDFFEYSSGCLLRSGIGKMSGYYTFRHLSDESKFEVEIPEFHMMPPWIKN